MGLPIAYCVYASYYFSKVSWSVYLQNIFYYNWIHLTGYGLFTTPMLHILWILILINIIFLQRSNKKKWHSLIRGSFEYWFMIMIAMYIVTKEWISFSSEMNVILLNIFVLYGLLQQLIVPTYIVKSWNKLGHRLRSANKDRA
ncbi:hypothetical protein [Paenibacillus psychroresistens]|uniref:hypothetical protein n=1 Tax=Paenibacillus psychroresistens TaxID=1778678 RepID=UPI001D054345|nr:hypothetical protein [Paenibacillus psychroresistens]